MVQFYYLRLFSGIETVSCRLLQRMARMDLDLNLKTFGQALKNHQKNYYGQCPLMKFDESISFFLPSS